MVAAAPGRVSWLSTVLVAAAFFVGVAPTLPWLEFAGGSENLVVETVLEMRRGGPWFIPTLQGFPRLSKPPLTAWITAAAVRPDTVARLSAPDPDARQAAFREFAWQVRWPTLLSACLMVVATGMLGDVLFGRPAGLISALACGSSLLFLRFSRSATTDVQLALWVAVANAFLALAFVRGRHWPGFVGAGVALGLALMSKGPVGLVQSVLPFAMFLLWRRFACPAVQPARGAPATGRRAAACVGLLAMLAVALPWYVVVLLRHPDIMKAWVKEVTREGATQLAPDPWYTYLVFFVWMLPWLSFLVAGTGVAARSVRRGGKTATDRTSQGFVLAMSLTVVPLLAMSFFKDKNERYTLPMVVPAAVLAAGAAVQWWRSDRRDPAGRVVEGAHWVTMLVLSAGIIAFAALGRPLGFDENWVVGWGVVVGAAAAAGVGFTFVLSLRRVVPLAGDAGMIAVAALSAVVLLALQYPVMRGYSRVATSDLKPLADVVWEKHPDAVLYEYEPGTRSRTYLDLPIYAGRLTRKVNDLNLPATDRPQVVVLFDRRSADLIPPAPWQPLAGGGGRKDRWRAYVLPAAH